MKVCILQCLQLSSNSFSIVLTASLSERFLHHSFVTSACRMVVCVVRHALNIPMMYTLSARRSRLVHTIRFTPTFQSSLSFTLHGCFFVGLHLDDLDSKNMPTFCVFSAHASNCSYSLKSGYDSRIYSHTLLLNEST